MEVFSSKNSPFLLQLATRALLLCHFSFSFAFQFNPVPPILAVHEGQRTRLKLKMDIGEGGGLRKNMNL